MTTENPHPEDFEHLQELRRSYTDRLQSLQQRAAKFGATASTTWEISDIERMLEEINKRFAEARDQDTSALIYFSGHGGQIQSEPEPEIDEKDALDEMLTGYFPDEGEQKAEQNKEDTQQPDLDKIAAQVYSRLRSRLAHERSEMPVRYSTFPQPARGTIPRKEGTTRPVYIATEEPNSQTNVPPALASILEEILAKTGLEESEVLERGLVLIAAILKAREAGLKVGFANKDNELVMEITGI